MVVAYLVANLVVFGDSHSLVPFLLLLYRCEIGGDVGGGRGDVLSWKINRVCEDFRGDYVVVFHCDAIPIVKGGEVKVGFKIFRGCFAFFHPVMVAPFGVGLFDSRFA